MKHYSMMNRGMSIGLAAVMCVSGLPAAAFAAESNTEKEEVVYANLNHDGTVDEINVVNILIPGTDGKIVDYGTYQSVRNMTTTDEITYTDDCVSADTSAEKLYYEGKLDSMDIPWNIRFHYYLDDREYSADELSGKSGKLKITMEITENKKCRGDFYEHYALQAILSFDTNKFENIEAEGATIANVGSSKQLTYTILPGKGADIKITADVSGFEMGEIAVNGIPLNLDIEVDDAELMEQVTDLLDAIQQIDDGTGELKDGAEKLQSGAENELGKGAQDLDAGAGQLQSGAGGLKTGAETLESGSKSLKSGADALDTGVKNLNSGISQVQAGLEALNTKSGELVSGSAQIKSALTQLQSALNGVSVSADEIGKLTGASSEIQKGIESLAAGAGNLQEQISFDAYKSAMAQQGLDVGSLQGGNTAAANAVSNYLGQVAGKKEELIKMGFSAGEIEAGIALANQVVSLLNGNNAAIGGMEAYLSGLQQGGAGITAGAEELQKNYSSFDAAIDDLSTVLTNLLLQMTDLKGAVDTLVNEYGKLDAGLNDYTDGVTQIAAGYEQVSSGAAALADGSGKLKTGSRSLYGGMTELLQGITKLYQASGTLKDGTGKLDSGVAELLIGVSSLYEGSDALKEGTDELRSETSDMDTEIEDKIDDLKKTITGDGFEAASFVSEKNTNIDSVQFVIKTPAIEEEKKEETVTKEEEPLSLKEKFLNLFGADEQKDGK